MKEKYTINKKELCVYCYFAGMIAYAEWMFIKACMPRKTCWTGL